MSIPDPLLAALPGEAAPTEPGCGPPIGLFEGTADLGSTAPGLTLYKAHADTYLLTGGGGGDIRGAEDSLHFAWRRFFGDGTVAAELRFAPGMRSGWEKAALLLRQTLEPGSAYAGVVVRSDGRFTLQYRQSHGAVTFQVAAFPHNPASLRLVRSGGRITAFAATAAAPLREAAMVVLPLRDPLYAGIGFCGQDPDHHVGACFSRVRIDA